MAEWEEGTYFSPLGDLALRRRSEVTWLQCSLPAGATWKNFSPSFAWKPSLLLGPGAYGRPFPDEPPGNLGLMQAPYRPSQGLSVSSGTCQHLLRQAGW